MKIYTKGGDTGTTSLVGGGRVSKSDPRVEAYGTVDELMANIGFLHDNLESEHRLPEICEYLKIILNNLMDISAALASVSTESGKVAPIKDGMIANLENHIDTLSSILLPVSNFTLPCGHRLVSQTHICRTVCRRAERRAVAALENGSETSDLNIISYLNRLSDYLYVLGRGICTEYDVKETLWSIGK